MPTTTETKKTPARKRTSGRRKPSARAAASRQHNAASTEGYGDTANRLMEKSQHALTSIYGWAGDKGRQIPRAISRTHLPGMRQSFAEDRSIILGAVGVGIGVLIGAMLPPMGLGSHGGGRNKASGARR